MVSRRRRMIGRKESHWQPTRFSNHRGRTKSHISRCALSVLAASVTLNMNRESLLSSFQVIQCQLRFQQVTILDVLRCDAARQNVISQDCLQLGLWVLRAGL